MKDEKKEVSPQNVGCIIAVIGAIIASIGVSLMTGCSLRVIRESDLFYLRHDVQDLQADVSQLKRDVQDLSRGYKIVPIKITITNDSPIVEEVR